MSEAELKEKLSQLKDRLELLNQRASKDALSRVDSTRRTATRILRLIRVLDGHDGLFGTSEAHIQRTQSKRHEYRQVFECGLRETCVDRVPQDAEYVRECLELAADVLEDAEQILLLAESHLMRLVDGQNRLTISAVAQVNFVFAG